MAVRASASQASSSAGAIVRSHCANPASRRRSSPIAPRQRIASAPSLGGARRPTRERRRSRLSTAPRTKSETVSRPAEAMLAICVASSIVTRTHNHLLRYSRSSSRTVHQPSSGVALSEATATPDPFTRELSGAVRPSDPASLWLGGQCRRRLYVQPPACVLVLCYFARCAVQDYRVNPQRARILGGTP